MSIASSLVMLALLLWGIMPGTVKIASRLELFFVNTLDLPPNSGAVFYMIVLAVMFIIAVRSSLISDNRTNNSLVTIAALFFTGIWLVSGSVFFNILLLILGL